MPQINDLSWNFLLFFYIFIMFMLMIFWNFYFSNGCFKKFESFNLFKFFWFW